MTKKAMLSLFLVCFLICSLNVASAATREYKGEGYTVRFPANWKIKTDPSTDRVTVTSPMEVSNGKKSIAIIGISVTRGGDMTLAGAIKFYKKSQKRHKNVKLTGEKKIKIGGQPAYKFVKKTFFKKNTIMAVDCITVKEGLFYMIGIQGPDHAYSKHCKILDQVLKSFRFK